MRLSSKVWASIFALEQASPSDFESMLESLCDSLDLLFAHYQSQINAVLSDLQIRNLLFVHHIVALMDDNCSRGRSKLSSHTIHLITEEYLARKQIPITYDSLKLKSLELDENLDFDFDEVDGASMSIGSREVS